MQYFKMHEYLFTEFKKIRKHECIIGNIKKKIFPSIRIKINYTIPYENVKKKLYPLKGRDFLPKQNN